MSDRKEIIDEKIEEIKEAENWQCGKYAAVDPEEYEKQCLLDLLVDYISEDNNYVVNNAIITCDHMTDKQVNIEYKKKTIKLSIGKDNIEIKNDSGYTDAWIHFYEAHIGEEGIGRLYAVHAAEQTDNGIPFATVIDCRCQREIDEGQSEGVASILSLGNCGILKESDIENIGSRNEKARTYGTCYCLMKLADEWINPFCIESVVGEHEKNDIFKTNTLGDVGALYTNKKPECKVVSHHKAMKWSTEQGQKEGLTLLSTLLCTRGGIISIVTSGQIKTDIEEEISGDEEESVSKSLAWKFKYDWAKEGLDNAEIVTPEFMKRVVEISNDLQIDPDDLMAVMAWESRFNPYAQNASGACGLIQFTQISLDQINNDNGTNYSKEDLKTMDAMEQLELVYLHYKPKTGLMHDIGDVYLVTFAPNYVNDEYNDDDTIVYSSEKNRTEYNANKDLDKENKGYITKGDAVDPVLLRREEYLYEN